MSSPSRVTTAINFGADGKQVDFMRVPFSSDASAYGRIPRRSPIPLGSVWRLGRHLSAGRGALSEFVTLRLRKSVIPSDVARGHYPPKIRGGKR
jgi:hypothetical protein